jgi:hypothetical protein
MFHGLNWGPSPHHEIPDYAGPLSCNGAALLEPVWTYQQVLWDDVITVEEVSLKVF